MAELPIQGGSMVNSACLRSQVDDMSAMSCWEVSGQKKNMSPRFDSADKVIKFSLLGCLFPWLFAWKHSKNTQLLQIFSDCFNRLQFFFEPFCTL